MADNILNEENQPSMGSMVDDLLKKYNLQEDAEKMLKKISEGAQPNRTVIGYLVKNLAEVKITEKDTQTSLQKSFGISSEVAQQIINDVKKSIVPYFKQVLKNRSKILTAEDSQSYTVQQKKSSTTEDVVAKPAKKLKGNSKKIENTLNEEKMKLPQKNIQPKKQTSSGPDSYRESIG